MIRRAFKHIGFSAVKLVTAASVLALALSGCGGGGGDGDDEEELKNQPAPQTFNGLVLTLYTGGVTLTFIRADGDTTTGGVETGAVTMNDNPASFTYTDSTGASAKGDVSSTISGARYVYARTSPEAGTLTITGSGSGVNSGGGIANYFQNPTFTHTYDLLFGTDGATITGVSVNDTGEGFAILWPSAVLRVFGVGSVPVGWSLKDSEGVNLPKLYPLSVSQQRLEITPADLATHPAEGYQFLTSKFTRFSNAVGDFLEEGVGNKDAVPALILINFDYQPDPNTTNRAKIRIYDGVNPVVTYDMTFLDLEKGTYVRENGSTGTFEYPFLDQ